MFNEQISKKVAFAEDFAITRKVHKIKSYWDMLQQVSPLYGYFQKPSKSYLFVKEHFYENVKETFKNSEVKLTAEDKRHHEPVIGSAAYKETSMKSLAEGWIEQLKLLSTIAESEPQTTYIAFLEAFKGQFIIS